ncbi:hypothetical protein BN946_scf184644.g6 [Trametes cinnabarina]|uniref:F-box domain-containing protein n=1 Tax=Pycnoporus cinnabarinus TaxID=5643 RepID=A0A060SNW4_PYCCI|nr:hypothetical protein BN946_scf184644.g6 [Trametes cinnabarina]
MRYAFRVRSLFVTPANDTSLRGQLVFDEIARTRSTLNLLPRLSVLSWTSHLGERLRLSLMFMHENVKHFEIRLVPSDNYSYAVYFAEIALRMPKLTCLDMRFTFPVRDFEPDLCKLFESLPHLQKVILPKYTFTSKVVEQLSKNPSLKVAQFEYTEEQGSGDPSDVHNWFPSLNEGAFPSLIDISVSVHLPHMVRFLKSGSCPAHLQCLYVHVLYIVPPSQVREFLDAVVEHCPQLTQLHIDFIGEPSPLMFRTRLSEEDRIGWSTLRPLLNLTKLTQFNLNWDAPLSLTQDDIEELAASMSALEVLTLCPEPIPCPQASPLTLRALIPFARHCHNMRELSLYLEASTTDLDDASRQLSASLPPIHFRRLQRLNFGLSPIPEPEPVALFLSQLCPPGCEINAGITWPEGFNGMEVQTPEDAAVLTDIWKEAGDWYPRWEEVNRVLPLLTKVRIEERLRRRELEREVEDLRMRSRVLEERLNVGVPHDGGCILA